MDDVVLGGGYSAWPSNATTSTEYFINLVTSGVMTVSFDFFSARGLAAYKSSSASDFKADGNAWNLVNFVGGEPKEGQPGAPKRRKPPEGEAPGAASKQ